MEAEDIIKLDSFIKNGSTSLREVAGAILADLEKVMEVIDWEDDIGVMREIKEGKYQEFKKQFGI